MRHRESPIRNLIEKGTGNIYYDSTLVLYSLFGWAVAAAVRVLGSCSDPTACSRPTENTTKTIKARAVPARRVNGLNEREERGTRQTSNTGGSNHEIALTCSCQGAHKPAQPTTASFLYRSW